MTCDCQGGSVDHISGFVTFPDQTAPQTNNKNTQHPPMHASPAAVSDLSACDGLFLFGMLSCKWLLKTKNVNHTDGFVALRRGSTANKQQKHTTPTDEALWCRSLLCESRGRESSRSHVKRIIDPRVFGCAAPGIVPSQGNT